MDRLGGVFVGDSILRLGWVLFAKLQWAAGMGCSTVRGEFKLMLGGKSERGEIKEPQVG
jgi:hypothetical protein